MNRKQSKISLNCSLSAPPTTLPGSKTPNTPEILNTIVSITSQMGSHEMPDTMSPSSVPFQFATPSVADAPSARLSSTTPTNIAQRDSNVSPTLVQDFKSQFIKEGLKMKLKKNMKLEDGDSLQEILARNIKKEQEDLSPEDEVKRKRRRERNKIAAEKCRIKKKKATLQLFAESEILEKANNSYKEDIERLREEQNQLETIIANHQLACKLKRKPVDCSSNGNMAALTIPYITSSAHNTNEPHLTVTTAQEYSEDPIGSDGATSEVSYQMRQSYGSMAYRGYGLVGGYYDSACAAV